MNSDLLDQVEEYLGPPDMSEYRHGYYLRYNGVELATNVQKWGRFHFMAFDRELLYYLDSPLELVWLITPEQRIHLLLMGVGV